MSGDSKVVEGVLFGLGNPLLDISATVNAQFLEKYKLKENDQILASEIHEDLFDNMVKEFKVDYIPGGAAQNSIRVAQWMLKLKQATTMTGCIGRDTYGKILEECVERDGVRAAYQYEKEVRTGTCAVCITDHKGVSLRSLVAYLGASNHLKLSHLDHLHQHHLITKASIYYMSGYALTVCPEALLQIAKQASEANKIVAMNLSAPFICQFFKEPLMQMMPYIDYLFGNETEFATFASENGIKSTELKDIAMEVSRLPKVNQSRPRIVVATQGAQPAYITQDAEVLEFAVMPIAKEQIEDTNGAGDAYVGGFLAGLVHQSPLQKCVEAANYAAHYILQKPGVQLPTPSTFHF